MISIFYKNVLEYFTILKKKNHLNAFKAHLSELKIISSFFSFFFFAKNELGASDPEQLVANMSSKSRFIYFSTFKHEWKNHSRRFNYNSDRKKREKLYIFQKHSVKWQMHLLSKYWVKQSYWVWVGRNIIRY